MRASAWCDKLDTLLVPVSGLKTTACKFHKVVSLSRDKKFRVNSQCEDTENINSIKWFVLPPIQEFYFRMRNPSYKTLPPFRQDCPNPQAMASMEMIYPKTDSKIFLPVELDGSPGKAIFEATHQQPSATIYWHLDGTYLGSTQSIHQYALALKAGKHTVTLMDDSGEVLERQFSILSHH
jgi:penicillin-binding protein 1C